MKKPHPTAKFLSNLAKQIDKLTPGSDAWSSLLKRYTKTAWKELHAANVDWKSVGSKTEYVHSTTEAVLTTNGPVVSRRTDRKVKPAPALESYSQKRMRKYAAKVSRRFERHCNWVQEQFTKAGALPNLPERAAGRILTVCDSLNEEVGERFAELEAMMAGAVSGGGRYGEIVKRNPDGVHIYRDTFYTTEREAMAAREADSEPLPSDHDKVCAMFDASLLPGGFDETKWEEIGRYTNSVEHREARGAAPRLKGKRAKLVKQLERSSQKLASLVASLPTAAAGYLGHCVHHIVGGCAECNAKDFAAFNEHKATGAKTLAAMSDRTLSEHLGLSRPYMVKLLGPKNRKNRDQEHMYKGVQEAIYKLSPSRRPRKKKTAQSKVDADIKAYREKMPPAMQTKFDAYVAEKDPSKVADLELELNKMINPKYPCKPDCKCIRHGAAA